MTAKKSTPAGDSAAQRIAELEAALAATGQPIPGENHGRSPVAVFSRDDTERDEALFSGPKGDRYTRALHLARRGELLPREVEHLTWMAGADNPFESLAAGSVPLTVDQAREVFAVADSVPQRGRDGVRLDTRPPAVGQVEFVETGRIG